MEYPGAGGEILHVGDLVVHRTSGFGVIRGFSGPWDQIIARVQFYGGFRTCYPIYLKKPSEIDLIGFDEEDVRGRLEQLWQDFC